MKKKITIAIDAMGGENAPKKNIEGLSIFLKKNKKNNDFFIHLFGDKKILSEELSRFNISNENVKVVHTDSTVSDKETPLTAVKNSKNTSMWNSIKAQVDDEADISLSAGNTGALFVIAKLNLEMLEKIDKPALSGLWPNKIGMNIVLDLGANIECNEKNLKDFSIMGAALHKSLFPDEVSKVALLNIGSEESKGNSVIKNTYQDLSKYTNSLFEFKGYIEGNNIMNGEVNVIIADGFTGNIALKTAEGTANFITSELKKTLTGNLVGKISSLLNIKNINNFKKKLDPRLYNGAILLGLNSPVVKSHGGTDYVGFANAISVCEKIIKGKLIDKIKENIN